MYVKIRSEDYLTLLISERCGMFHVRRVRGARLVNVCAIRFSANYYCLFRYNLRLQDGVIVCRFLVATWLNNVVTSCTLIPMQDVIFIRYVKYGIRRAVVR